VKLAVGTDKCLWIHLFFTNRVKTITNNRLHN
jgi:hypothetical protein